MHRIKVAIMLPVIMVIACLVPGPRQRVVIEHVEIYVSPEEYCAWPAMIQAENGDILVFFCSTEEHLAPNGKIVLVRSSDHGRTWGAPELVFDSPVDDRDAGVTLLKDGRIITHFWSTHWSCEDYLKLPDDAYPRPVIERWCDEVNQPHYVEAKKWHGAWQLISYDHGKTWGEPMPGKDSIHGGVQLNDGTLLLACYRQDENGIGVYGTPSPAAAWTKLAEIRSPDPASVRFAEPHIIQLASGRIVMMIRSEAGPNQNDPARRFLWATYSDDLGRTWVEPYETPLWGYPPHLLQLSDGRVICVYGHRRPPYGQRACVSDDGITWHKEREIVLRDDAINDDLGYPVSVELKPGVVLTAYYQTDPKFDQQRQGPPNLHRHRPDILGTIWRVPER